MIAALSRDMENMFIALSMFPALMVAIVLPFAFMATWVDRLDSDCYLRLALGSLPASVEPSAAVVLPVVTQVRRKAPRLVLGTSLALAALSGCDGPAYPMKVYVEVGEIELFQSAASASGIWNEQLGRTAVAYVSSADERVKRWHCDYVRVIVEDPKEDKVGLCTKRPIGPHCGVTIRIRRDHVGRVDTMIHELGHALGVEHNPDPESYMYENERPGAGQILTVEDLEQADKTLDDA